MKLQEVIKEIQNIEIEYRDTIESLKVEVSNLKEQIFILKKENNDYKIENSTLKEKVIKWKELLKGEVNE